MQSKKGIICGIVIISFLCVQFPTPSLAKYFAADQETTQVTRNAPQFKTTAPEPLAAPEAKPAGKKHTLWWGLAGLAALAGLLAAVMSGSDGGDDPPPDETGSVQVEW
jgi:hypothetical protein